MLRTDGRTERRKDNVKTVYPPPPTTTKKKNIRRGDGDIIKYKYNVKYNFSELERGGQTVSVLRVCNCGFDPLNLLENIVMRFGQKIIINTKTVTKGK